MSNKKKSVKRYFGCWCYREENCEPVVILSLHKKLGDMFIFPLENKFGYRDKKGNFIPNNNSIISCMFGFYSFGRLPHSGLLIDTKQDLKNYCREQSKLIGYSFYYGGIITDKISEHWVGKDIKILSKDLSGLGLREDLNSFSEIIES